MIIVSSYTTACAIIIPREIVVPILYIGIPEETCPPTSYSVIARDELR